MKLKIASMLGLAVLASTLAQAAGAQPVNKGRQFYEKVCAKCHEAGIGPVLKGRGLPAATYKIIARSGLNGMPAFRVSDIDDATLDELANYLSSTPVSAPAAPQK